MKCSFFKVIVLCLILHNWLIGSPITHVIKNRECLRTVEILARSRNQLRSQSHKTPRRNFATGLETVALTAIIAEVAPALGIAVPCVAVAGGACYTLAMFYEVFNRLPTPTEIEHALVKNEVELAKTLWEKAQKLAKKTGERADAIYDRLMFSEAQKKILESQQAMQAWEQHVRERKQQELEQLRSAQIKSASPEKVSPQAQPQASVKQASLAKSTESAVIAPSTTQPQELTLNQSTAISSPTQPLHTGHTIPVPKSDPGCTLLPAPQVETSLGCGSTTAVVPETPSGFQIAEQPNSTIACEFPAEIQQQRFVLQNPITEHQKNNNPNKRTLDELLKDVDLPKANSEKAVQLENPAHDFVQYEKLKELLKSGEFTSVIDVTEHGLKRLIERGFEADEVISIVTKPDTIATQHDGAKVFIKEFTPNRYMIIALNQKTKEVVTALKQIDLRALQNLSKNYGWRL